MDNKKVWYVTGASRGLGLALVKMLLEEEYPVAASFALSHGLDSSSRS
ncbi:hypothetical protein ACQ86N_20250 [Puia sp. P3]